MPTPAGGFIWFEWMTPDLMAPPGEPTGEWIVVAADPAAAAIGCTGAKGE